MSSHLDVESDKPLVITIISDFYRMKNIKVSVNYSAGAWLEMADTSICLRYQLCSSVWLHGYLGY